MKRRKAISVVCFALVFLWGMAAAPAHAYTPKQIYQKAGPGVVFIFASKGSSKGSGGTGSIISPDGLVITNAHIFTQKDSPELLTDISIFLKPRRITGNHKTDLATGYRGKIIDYDIPLDLALVKIMNLDRKLVTVPFADSEMVEIGDQVYAIGHPEQGGLWSLTTGVISAYWSSYGGVAGKDMFQTDASINRGNSGGPLLDEQGTMIGINSMIARKAADGLTITDVNFSIRSKVAIDWLNQKGYRIAAVRREAAQSDEPEETIAVAPRPSAPKVKTAPAASPEETAPTPQASEKPMQPPAAPPQTVEKKEPVPPKQPPPPKEQPVPDLSPTPPPKKTEPLAKSQPPKTAAPDTPKQGQILTEKKPYRMDELLEGMREMEDLMDEMKGMIDEFRERRTK